MTGLLQLVANGWSNAESPLVTVDTDSCLSLQAFSNTSAAVLRVVLNEYGTFHQIENILVGNILTNLQVGSVRICITVGNLSIKETLKKITDQCIDR